MSFGVKEQRKEPRINRHRHAEGNTCGACGEPVDAKEILCTECRLDTLVGAHDELEDAVLAAVLA